MESIFSAFENIVVNLNAVKGDSERKWFTTTELTGWHLSLAGALGIGKGVFAAEKLVQSV